MTKVTKGEFKKLEDLKVNDVSLTCDTSLEVFNNEFNQLSRMDDDLFTYEVEVANILCNSNKDDDSEQRVSHEADDDMGYDPSDDRHMPMCKAFKEFNYLLQIDPDLLTKDIEGFKTYEEYKDDWIYEWNKDIPWVDEKPWTDIGVWTEPTLVKHYSLMDCELKEQALRNKAIMEGLISDDESSNDAHKLPVCNMRRFKMIKYSLGQDEEYVAIKEDEYDDLARRSDDACRAYQENFRMMNEGWMDLVKEILMNIGGEFTNLEILKYWSLETSRRLFNIILLNKSSWRIYRENIKGVSHSNSF
ncbi:hypothetical protein Tco_0752391 [Tanacetum coccineum]|uniref:Uncharacterized protein n=1 Tax=Tanacetum coccineum TaxID=301880 RepID=A0ABQ4Z7Q3_9ASTR